MGYEEWEVYCMYLNARTSATNPKYQPKPKERNPLFHTCYTWWKNCSLSLFRMENRTKKILEEKTIKPANGGEWRERKIRKTSQPTAHAVPTPIKCLQGLAKLAPRKEDAIFPFLTLSLLFIPSEICFFVLSSSFPFFLNSSPVPIANMQTKHFNFSSSILQTG